MSLSIFNTFFCNWAEEGCYPGELVNAAQLYHVYVYKCCQTFPAESTPRSASSRICTAASWVEWIKVPLKTWSILPEALRGFAISPTDHTVAATVKVQVCYPRRTLIYRLHLTVKSTTNEKKGCVCVYVRLRACVRACACAFRQTRCLLAANHRHARSF